MLKKACLSCGKPLEKDDLFCRNCGSAVNDDPVEVSAEPSSPISSARSSKNLSENPHSLQSENEVISTLDLGGGKTVQAGTDAGNSAAQMKSDLRGWGLLMIFWGILSLIFTKYLDPVWGIIIIGLGIVNLLVIRRFMFVVNGIALFIVGILNIFATLAAITSSGISSFWLATGIMQIVWGIQEIVKYDKFSPWRGFSAYPLRKGGAVGRFAVIPMDRRVIEDPSEVTRQTLDQGIEKLAKLWISEELPGGAELMISGYDADKRELYEIPEVCTWAKRAVLESPVLPYFLSKTSLDRLTAWLCGPVSQEATRTQEFSQLFIQTRNNCFSRAVSEAPNYFKRLGASQSTFEKIHDLLISGEKELSKTGRDGHTYTATLRSGQEMRRYRRGLPWRATKNAPLLFVLGLVLACVIMTGTFILVNRLLHGSPIKINGISTLVNNGTRTATGQEGEICWTDELTNFNGNRSQVWDDYLKEEIKAKLSFTQFKDEVVSHNPVLAADGYIFYSQKTYLLPESCQ